jgi:hypothetical protein
MPTEMDPPSATNPFVVADSDDDELAPNPFVVEPSSEAEPRRTSPEPEAHIEVRITLASVPNITPAGHVSRASVASLASLPRSSDGSTSERRRGEASTLL